MVYLERWLRTVIGLWLKYSNRMMMMMMMVMVMMMMMMIPFDGREGSGTGGINFQEYQKPFHEEARNCNKISGISPDGNADN